MDKWNEIVKLYNNYKHSEESQIQSLWEAIFAEYFGYSRLKNEVESHRSSHIGSTDRIIPDIILKRDDKDLFLVELKRHEYSFDIKMQEQLFSYLKQFKLSVGILICDKIYVYYYDYNKSDNEQAKIEIGFKENNEDGKFFIDLFLKENFSKDKVKEFINEKNNLKNNVFEIQKSLSNDLLVSLLKDYFLSQYKESEINKALEDYEILINKKANLPPIVIPEGRGRFLTHLNRNITKHEAVDLCIQNNVFGIEMANTTFANLDASGTFYPANVDKRLLHQTWFLILVDNKNN